MPVWSVAPVESEPSTTLVRWQILELSIGDRHLVGWAAEAQEGRVCSVVRTFDVARLRGATRSGRVYQLTGKPGVDSQAAYVWQRWLALNDEPAWVDVTASVWAKHVEAMQAESAPLNLAAARSADHE